ncbi:hypothetical protein LCGC14_0491330 [marine sediment metagenome]|uniref:Uracil-DNA glycosylase-like domain-containing protein n=1 Tax=marine sediment metagenome TaxID=412755 RepID=A0A0F9S6F1_9ZZZZ
MIVRPRGPQPAKFLVVGEAPGGQEVSAGVPFVGQSGQEGARELQESGIPPESCRFTNVTMQRPPGNRIDEFFRTSKKKGVQDGAIYHRGQWAMPVLLEGIENLRREIIETNPNVVIALGNTALWACTGEWGITRWRGSQMVGNIDDVSFRVVPTYHPAFIMRRWDQRWIALEDYKRANRTWREPDYDFLIRPSYGDVITWLDGIVSRLNNHTVKLAVDIETRSRQIACIGIADSDRHALCIPILCVENPSGYWDLEEELQIVLKIREVITHPNAHIVGQNYIYDMQYFARQYGIRSRLSDDTMLKHHCAMPGTRRGLDFLSSIYCRYHRYWKDESKEWNPKVGEEQLWIYNCKDCVATFEANENLDAVIKAFGLTEQYAFQMKTNATAFNMMLRGVNVNKELKAQCSLELSEVLINLRNYVEYILSGFSIFGPKGVSSKKMMTLAYQIFKLPPKYRQAGKKKALTANKEAVEEWCHSVEPIFRPVLEAIREFRSLLVYKSTFADSALDWDGRFRCSINVSGAETFRFSTSTDAFGFGTNMQNLPKKKD